MAAVCVMAGCYGHNCDGDLLTFGQAPGEGRLIDENTWESSPIDGDWLPFTKQRIWVFQFPQLGDRVPYEVTPLISAEQNPNRDQTNATIGSGNLAEQSNFGPGTVWVKNDTCADYFVRVVVKVPPRPPPIPTAAADASAGDADASP
jgi:hypothetical protein